MQQVNLYQARFRKQQPVFLASALVRALTVVFGGLLLISAYGLWSTMALEARLSDLHWQHDASLHQLATIERELEIQAPDPLLMKEVERLRSLESGKRLELRQLGEQRIGSTEGFVDYLEGLARQRPPKLWFTHIHLRHGGAEVELKGNSYDANEVPQFLQNLATEPAYSGMLFKQFVLLGEEKDRGKVSFSIQTSGDER